MAEKRNLFNHRINRCDLYESTCVRYFVFDRRTNCFFLVFLIPSEAAETSTLKVIKIVNWIKRAVGIAKTATNVKSKIWIRPRMMRCGTRNRMYGCKSTRPWEFHINFHTRVYPLPPFDFLPLPPTVVVFRPSKFQRKCGEKSSLFSLSYSRYSFRSSLLHFLRIFQLEMHGSFLILQLHTY